MIQTLEQGFQYLESFTNFEKKTSSRLREYRLDRMKVLLEAFDRPDLGLDIYHIAGSKGKGSTGIFLAKLLESQGLSTGLYTSPHVYSYTERITQGGRPFPGHLYINSLKRIEAFLEKNPEFRDLPPDIDPKPTTFELLTLLAFLVFREAKMQAIVLETGLGGRLDATNLCQPKGTIITSIELEHQEILGPTLTHIAREKGGIFKKGIPVFLGDLAPEAESTLLRIAKEKDAPVITEPWVHTKEDWGPFGGTVQSENHQGYLQLKMLGIFQRKNLALALRTFLYFFPQALPTDYMPALEQAFLPGRMELISMDPFILLDGGHTPKAMSALVETVRRLSPKPKNLIFGALEGKDIWGMAAVLAPHFDQVILTTPGFFRPSKLEDMHRAFEQAGSKNTLTIADPREALDWAKKQGGGFLATGSFYLLGEIRPWL